MTEITIIGDATVDNFILLTNQYVHTLCNTAGEDCQLVLPYGEKIPVQDVEVHLGGNAANVAVGLKRLKLNIHPLIPLGRDVYSNIALGVFAREGIEIAHSLIKEENRCNVSFIFRYSGDRTIFSHHEAKEYIIPEEIKTPYTYYTSHSGDNVHLSTKVLSAIGHNSKLLFAPSNTQIKGDVNILEALIAKSYLTICNREEAYEILKKLDDEDINVNHMLHRLKHLGAKNVVVTDGEHGVYYLEENSEEVKYRKSILNNDEVVEATGAGDAMCSGVIYGVVKYDDLERGIQYGLKNSASVLSHVGSQIGLLRSNDIE